MASLQVAGLHLRSGDREVTGAASLPGPLLRLQERERPVRAYPEPPLIEPSMPATHHAHTRSCRPLLGTEKRLYHAI